MCRVNVKWSRESCSIYLGAMHELPCQAYVLHAAGTQQGLHKDLQQSRRILCRRSLNSVAREVETHTSMYQFMEGNETQKRCHLKLQPLLFLSNRIIPCNILLLFLPGDMSPVLDRCRHSAACQAGLVIDLSTPSHSLEGFWTHT